MPPGHSSSSPAGHDELSWGNLRFPQTPSPGPLRGQTASPSPYDPIAGIYDPWSRSVTEDVEFYVEEALASGGPVVELAVGTGRIAVPIAEARIAVVGVDRSEEMLAVARRYAADRGVEAFVDLRLGDLRDPPVNGRVPLVIIPFRSLLHMQNDDDRLDALRAVHRDPPAGRPPRLRRLRAE